MTKAQTCPYCGERPHEELSPQARVLGGMIVRCDCAKADWWIPINIWNDIHPGPTDELKSAYEQFRSSLEAEKEKVAEIVLRFLEYKHDLLLKNNTSDWQGHKADAHRMPKWVALMEEIEKYADGEQ